MAIITCMSSMIVIINTELSHCTWMKLWNIGMDWWSRLISHQSHTDLLEPVLQWSISGAGNVWKLTLPTCVKMRSLEADRLRLRPGWLWLRRGCWQLLVGVAWGSNELSMLSVRRWVESCTWRATSSKYCSTCESDKRFFVCECKND